MSQNTERGLLVHQVIEAMLRSTGLHHRNIERQFSNTGLHRSQRRLLLHLSRLNCTPSQRELADEFDVSPACIARALKALVSEGYIRRTDNEDDQRRNDVYITDKGLNVVADSTRTFNSVEQQAFEGFDEHELRLLLEMLQRVQQNLREGEVNSLSQKGSVSP